MLSLKQIPDPKDTDGLSGNKRRALRYGLNDNFPFKTKLTLYQNSGVKSAESKGKDWSATAVDLSASGANIKLSLAAVAFQREACCLKISRGDYLLEIPGTVAHFRCGAQFSQCGISFNFPNAEVQQAYLQLLEPIVIANSLIPVPAVQDASGRHMDHYGNGTSASLRVWRDAPGGQIVGFDLRMNRFVIRWNDGATELDISGLADAIPGEKSAPADEFVALTETEHEDLRWLFCLAVPNLSSSVPQDVRSFLATLVA